MSSGNFRFKQFTIKQEEASFRVTTDSVLLGAWAQIEGAGTILDIGTGTGLLALMAAQRTDANIVAIEPDHNSYVQAGLNFDASPWKERITLLNTPVQDFNPEGGSGFDAIISNPPYFIDSLLNPDADKARTRHTITLSQADLLGAVVRLLNPGGTLHMVLPVTEAERFLSLAVTYDLFCSRRMLVRPTPARPPSRVLMMFGREAVPCTDDEIIIEKGERHIYSDEYVSLT
ncbi:MAG: methyltransferase, partial [Bacteroidales bacterium]|nr:methyltransferase [Bacteroidales bacterium]